ncbi:hypothetical protein CDAR_505811 [Caerostris darwini]|uniref:Uncharacterized protein n=1 Tax=Caerostris darwini TaxID=1538125 RepID=A0AAV4QDL0_9ARAC|nr:hypothetical protein CDAR_505811 [Caerostris darwini]
MGTLVVQNCYNVVVPGIFMSIGTNIRHLATAWRRKRQEDMVKKELPEVADYFAVAVPTRRVLWWFNIVVPGTCIWSWGESQELRLINH